MLGKAPTMGASELLKSGGPVTVWNCCCVSGGSNVPQRFVRTRWPERIGHVFASMKERLFPFRISGNDATAVSVADCEIASGSFELIKVGPAETIRWNVELKS